MFFAATLERRILSMPEVGDMAPDFELGSNMEKGKKVKLSDFRDKQNVVLAFYPLAWTPV
jgi:mycoredoxin-dependent peroxiredoxin